MNRALMVSIAQKAKEIYEKEFRQQLEATHRDQYVAIEPVSREYFVGETFVAAALAAREAFPDRPPFVVHIGHETAFHLGASAS